MEEVARGGLVSLANQVSCFAETNIVNEIPFITGHHSHYLKTWKQPFNLPVVDGFHDKVQFNLWLGLALESDFGSEKNMFLLLLGSPPTLCWSCTNGWLVSFHHNCPIWKSNFGKTSAVKGWNNQSYRTQTDDLWVFQPLPRNITHKVQGTWPCWKSARETLWPFLADMESSNGWLVVLNQLKDAELYRSYETQTTNQKLLGLFQDGETLWGYDAIMEFHL